MTTPFHVLLIEDELGDAVLVRHAFEQAQAPATCHHVSDGELGLDYLEQSFNGSSDQPRPHLILLDLNMPKVDGREFLSRLRADSRFKALPVVVLTTSNAVRDVELAYHLGANSYITKPVEIDDLFKTIRTVADYWFRVVTLPN